MELGVGVAAHGDPRLNADDDEGGVVEAVFSGQGELLFCGLGRQLYVGRDGAEDGHDAKDALGLLVSVGTDGVGVCGCLLGGGGRGWSRWGSRGLLGLRIKQGTGSVWKFWRRDNSRLDGGTC